jgi:hypothetical protein
LVLLPVLAAAIGCRQLEGEAQGPKGPVPYPIILTLPKEIAIHPFTGIRVFDEAGGIKGVDVRIQAFDASGDSTKAFGDFRFELYAFRANSLDPRGARLATWEVPVADPKTNALHWDSITRAYKFKLQWEQPIPVGQQYVLAAVFSSAFTERLMAQRVFVAGQ